VERLRGPEPATTLAPLFWQIASSVPRRADRAALAMLLKWLGLEEVASFDVLPAVKNPSAVSKKFVHEGLAKLRLKPTR
jgi:hypothetical protein